METLRKAKEICESISEIDGNENSNDIWNCMKGKSVKLSDYDFYRDYEQNCSPRDLDTEMFKKIYLPELYVSILYTLGRVYFYDKTKANKTICEKYLHKSQEICEEVYKSTKSIRLLHSLLVERNGSLYLDIESKDSQRINNAINKYEQELSYINKGDNKEVSTYYEFGKKKIDSNNLDIYYELVCYSQLLKCVVSLKSINATDVKIDEKAKIYLAAIASRLKKENELKRRQVSHGRYYNDLGDFYRAYDHADESIESYELAVNIASIKPIYILADAYYGLAKIYEKKGDFKNAANNAKECLEMSKKIYSEQDKRFIEAEALYNDLSIIHENVSFVERENIRYRKISAIPQTAFC